MEKTIEINIISYQCEEMEQVINEIKEVIARLNSSTDAIIRIMNNEGGG